MRSSLFASYNSQRAQIRTSSFAVIAVALFFDLASTRVRQAAKPTLWLVSFVDELASLLPLMLR